MMAFSLNNIYSLFRILFYEGIKVAEKYFFIEAYVL